MRKQLLLALGSVALGVVVVGSFALGQGDGDGSSAVSGAADMTASGPGTPDGPCPHKRVKGAAFEFRISNFEPDAKGVWATPEEAVRRLVERQRIPHDSIEDGGSGTWRVTNNGREEARVSIIEQPRGGFDVASWTVCSERSERFPDGQPRKPKQSNPPIDAPATDTAR